MYCNLEAELKRYGITREEIAKALNITVSTTSAKLTDPDRLKLSEAVKIKKTFFPNENLEYLFDQRPTINHNISGV